MIIDELKGVTLFNIPFVDSPTISETPFKNIVPLLLGSVLVTELVAGVLCLLGIVQFLMNKGTSLAYYGAIISCVALLMLLLGQRIAKDYEGAKTIAIYFIPAIFLVFLLQW